MRFLPGFLETKAASSNQAIARATGLSSGGGFSAATVLGKGWNVDKQISDGLERVIWVFRCVDAIASNASRLPIVVRDGDMHSGKVVEDKDLFRLLNRHANTYEVAQLFRYRLSAQLLLSPMGAFVEIVPGKGGRAAELHLLPPGSTEPIKDPKTFVKGYKVKVSGGGDFELKPEQVMWIRTKPHPTDPYRQLTPLTAAQLAAETDYYARLFNKNFLQRDGRPGFLVSVQGQLDPDDAKELKRRFSGGPTQAGETTVIEADSVTLSDLTSSPRDVQWIEAIKGSKEDLLLAFGVPESVMGNASGRTYDNADAERENFWMDTMIPHCDGIGYAFDVLTAKGKEDDFFVGHDYDTVDVLQRRKKERHDKAREEFTAGLISWNEYREATGKKQWQVPAANMAFLPNMVVVTQSEKDIPNVAQLPMITPPQGAAPGGNPAQQSQESRRGAIMGVREGMRSFQNQQAARALSIAGKSLESKDLFDDEEDIIEAEIVEDVVPPFVVSVKAHPYSELRAAIEGQCIGAMLAWDTSQEKVFADRLMHTKVRQHTRHWEGSPGTKALDPKYVTQTDSWVDDLVSQMERIIRPMAEKEARRAAKEMLDLGITEKVLGRGRGDRDQKSPLGRLTGQDKATQYEIVDDAVNNVLDVVRKSATRQTERVEKLIEQMDAEGKSIRQITDEIRRQIGTRSSWRKGLATNVTTTAVEGVKAAVYGHGGRFIRKQWMTEEDERVRVSHHKAHGQSRPADKAFRVGSTDIYFPGDPTAPIEEVANCRCWLTWTPT